MSPCCANDQNRIDEVKATNRCYHALGVSGGVPPRPLATRGGPGGGIGMLACAAGRIWLGRGRPGGGGGVARGACVGTAPVPGGGNPVLGLTCWKLIGAAGGAIPCRGLGGGPKPIGIAEG